MENPRSHAKSPRATNRDKIVQAAMVCFVERGIANSSVRDIAEHAGVSQGNLYNHFRSKDALIAEIARLDADEMHQVAEAALGLPPLPGLLALCEVYLAMASRPEDAVLTLEITTQALRDPEIAKSFAGGRDMLRTRMQGLVQSAQAAGSLPDTLSPPDTVATLLDLLNGMGLRLGLNARAATPQETATLHRAIHGVLGISAP